MASTSTSKPFPGFSKIYTLSDTSSDRWFRAELDVTREQALGLTRAEITLPSPALARHYMGSKKPSDIIGTTWAAPLLVSERLISVLRDAGFTGWSTYDIELRGHDGAPIPGYRGLAIHGRCGSIDRSKSVRVIGRFTSGEFSLWRGICFDPDTWDGSDLFLAVDSRGTKLITEEVKQALEKAKIKNADYTPLTEAEWFKRE